MASSINASTSGAGGVITTADNTGILNLQTASTTAITIDASQRAAFVAGTAALPAITTTGDTNTGMFFPAADTIAFAEGGTEAMRLDSSGKVGIGTASLVETLSLMTASGSTSIRLSTNNNQNNNVSLVNNATNFIIGTNHGTTGNKITMNLQCPDNALTIDASGYLTCPGVYSLATSASNAVHVTTAGLLYRSTSALKYKQDIRDLELIDINKFRPVRYKSKCEMDDQTKDHFGIIADEVDKAGITELVNYGVDGEVEGLRYERLTVVLLKAIQEQQTIINDLKARVTALEGATL